MPIMSRSSARDEAGERQADQPGQLSRSRSKDPLLAIAVVLFTIVFLANSWVGDDAYITFRVSDNLLHGFGLRWNVAERVQAFTNPLWMFVIAGAAIVTGEYYYTSLLVSLVCGLAMFAVLRRRLGDASAYALCVALLVTSKAFVDYTSSGLEYPLSFLLLALFATSALQHEASLAPAECRYLPRLTAIAALAFVNRADTLLLFAPTLVYLVARHALRRDWSWFPRVALASSPAWLWVVFTIIYYGFPLPNTYYAKVATGVSLAVRLQQGLAYTANSVRFDPVTLGSIAVAVIVVWARHAPLRRSLAAGAMAYVLYTIWVGGDFMAGRFFALPFVLAVILLSWSDATPSGRWLTIAGLVVLNLLNPLAPIKTGPNYDMGWPWKSQNGIKDERGGYHEATNVLFFDPFRPLPDHVWVREGKSLAASPERVFVRPSIGFIGYYGGPEKYIIDANGLSDPLLARLPVTWDLYFDFWTSHYNRPVPEGYVESRKSGRNELTDPVVREYYGRLLNVTTAPLFSWSRWKDIVELNLGRSRRLDELVLGTRLVDAGVRAGNARFQTDVGEVDREQFVHTTSRAGYLLLGPRLPLPAGTFEVAWTGNTGPASLSGAGFVQVCHHDCREILAQAVLRAEASGTIASLTFSAPRDVSDIEFRVFVNEGVTATLHRVSLKQRR